MKTFYKYNTFIILAYIILFPILPSYGGINADLILYLSIFYNLAGVIFSKNIREDLIKSLRLIYKDRIFITLFLLNLLMYVSTIYALDKRHSLVSSIRFSFYIYFFYLISYQLNKREDLNKAIYCFIFVATISGIDTFIKVINSTFRGIEINEASRITSFLENANNLGAYSVISLLMSIAIFIDTKNKKLKVAMCFSTLLLTLNIIFCQSRNALLALVIGIVIFILLYNKKLIMYSLIIPIILLIVPQSRVRLIEILDFSQNSSRVKIWTIAKYMIEDSPLKGKGYENFSTNYESYLYQHTAEDLQVKVGYIPAHPHNAFLKFQSELGILGLILFIIFLVITALTIFKFYKSYNDSTFILGILVIFLVFQFMNLLDCFYNVLKPMTAFLFSIAIANNININCLNKSKNSS